MSQAYVRVITGVDGTIHIEPKNSLFPRTGLRVANGTHEVRRGVPFKILITNFTHAPRLISKHMIVAYAVRHPTLLVALEGRGADEIAAALALPNTRAEPHARHGPTPIDPAFPVARTQGPVVMPTITPTVTPLEPDSSWRDTVDLEHVDDPALWDRILGMLEKHQTMWNGRLGAIKATFHRIALKPNTRPIHQQPYRAGPKSRAILEEHIQSQLEAGVIEPAQSEWASPIVLAPKNDGTLCFCVDYRRLNNAIIPDTYPLPRMDDCIDSLGEAAVFTTLDANSGYWQLPLAAQDKDKTTFTSHCGAFRYTRMPFGLRNAPATFQRALDIILTGVRWKTCLVYLDDVIIFSKSMEEHVQHVDDVLELLGNAGISLKLKKCEFFQHKVKYLGHVLLPGKLAISTDATSSIHDALFPEDITQLRSFLGACNVYGRFIHGFAKVAYPLHQMLGKNSDVDWGHPTEPQRNAINNIKEALVTPPVLALPRLDRPFMIDTDASAYQVGAVLLQQQDDDNPRTWATIGYWS